MPFPVNCWHWHSIVVMWTKANTKLNYVCGAAQCTIKSKSYNFDGNFETWTAITTSDFHDIISSYVSKGIGVNAYERGAFDSFSFTFVLRFAFCDFYLRNYRSLRILTTWSVRQNMGKPNMMMGFSIRSFARSFSLILVISLYRVKFSGILVTQNVQKIKK